MQPTSITIDGIEYDLVPKQSFIKSEIDLLKEKYATGNYIAVYFSKNKQKWILSDQDYEVNYRLANSKTKLIHQRHLEVLDAYLVDNTVEIEYEYDEETHYNAGWYNVDNFINEYNENREYRLKPQTQYPIFKRDVNDVVIMYHNENENIVVLSEYLTDIGCMDTTDIDNSYLESVEYDYEREFYHLQPVWFECEYSEEKRIWFYSCKTKTVEGYVPNTTLNNIEPITIEQLKTMPFIWDMYKQVLKENK